jgi:CspA family cold shock protein
LCRREYTKNILIEGKVRFMRRGRVKWFNNDKGYGFIENTEVSDEDIFVHYSSINQNGYKSLKEGELVEFTLIETCKGNQAIDVSEVFPVVS